MTDREALENLFVEIAGSNKPFHWDKRIMVVLDDAAAVIGRTRTDELFAAHPNNPVNKT